ncbi:hypothetical protein CHARACLAT_032960, partial [Characodon lateralis]|nr:hypothetical protein [Characodon lateralis]
TVIEKLTWKDRLSGYFMNISSILFMFGLTFSAVFGVIIYRITISALMAMSPDPEIKSNVRVTVTATAVIINLVVILILDEIYGAVALWLTELGMKRPAGHSILWLKEPKTIFAVVNFQLYRAFNS